MNKIITSKTNKKSHVEVSQIKQKFGGLRIYHHNTPEDLRQLIDEAVAASWHTCEKCGSTIGVTTNLEGYRFTLCPDCRKEIKPRTPLKRRIVIRRRLSNYGEIHD